MKTMKYFIFLISLTACHNNKTTKSSTNEPVVTNASKTIKQTDTSSFKAYKLIGDYFITDTGYFNIGIGDGVYGVVKENNRLVDTIELGYGIKRIDDVRYIYHTVIGDGLVGKGDANPKYKKSIMANLGSYTVVRKDKKELLNKLTRYFDDYYSSPSVINHRIYYWQIKKIDTNGKIRVSAAEYDFTTKRTNDQFIMNDILETDDSGYFPSPYQKNDTIYFDAGKNKLMKYSKDFKRYN
jgi:hypothetical protein